jgi:L-iditol 2-dehydrogenase
MIETEAIRLTGPKTLRRETRRLATGPDEVIVETQSTSICDADLRAWRGKFMPEDLPSFEWIGHEGGGRIIEVGPEVSDLKLGDRVMCFGPTNAWARHFKAKQTQVLKMPAELSDEHGCLGEPTAVGLYAAYHTEVQVGDTVAVVGLNYQGLLAVKALKLKGAHRLIAIDYSDVHLGAARAAGADELINSTDNDPRARVAQITGGSLCDVVFHSCGYWNPNAENYFNLAADITRDEGRFVSVPDMMEPIRANLHRFHHHAISVKFPALMHHNPHYLRMWAPRVLRPVGQGLINPGQFVSERVPWSDLEEGMDLFARDPDQIKIVVQI